MSLLSFRDVWTALGRLGNDFAIGDDHSSLLATIAVNIVLYGAGAAILWVWASRSFDDWFDRPSATGPDEPLPPESVVEGAVG